MTDDVFAPHAALTDVAARIRRAPVPAVNMAGQRHGRLLVIQRDPAVAGRAWWLCVCDCGNFAVRRGSSIRRGDVQSCGCLVYEQIAKTGRRARTHGLSKTPIYRAWGAMIRRCYRSSEPCYDRYGGRGITVCDEWRVSFEAFHRDMGDRSDGMQLDRIDNDGPYAPWNCRWATPKQNMSNRRVTIKILHQGAEVPIGILAGSDPAAYRRLYHEHVVKPQRHQRAAARRLALAEERQRPDLHDRLRQEAGHAAH